MATTATSPPSQRAKPNLLSSPDASTSAILGASSSGWNHSPRKPISMTSPPSSSELNQSPSGINNQVSHHQSQSPRKISNSFTQLKRNGLVSNSIFTQSNDNNNNNSPVNSSSPGKVLNRKPQTGLGLGIGVGSATPNNNHSPVSQRQTSSERPSPHNPSHINHTRQRSDAENHPNVGGGGGGGTGMLKYNHTGESNIGNGKVGGVLPRKSKGVDILHKGSYVSNSPFKGGNPTSMNSSNSNSDFGGSSAGGSPIRRSSPNKPSPSTSQDGFLPTTPTKSKSTNSASSSPTKSTNSPTQSLLVSNRLRGPREIPSSPTINDEAENGNGNGVNGNAGVKRERRKTVTFDEVLEVQEFDKESSFDNGSLRSDLSNSGMEIESQLFNGNQNQDEEEGEGEERVWRSDADGIDVFESSPISKNKLRIKNGSPLISDGDENSPYLNQNQGDQLELTPSISSSSSTTSSSNYSSEPESQLVTPEINAPALAEFDISKELGENSFNDGEKSFNTAANYETDAERSFKSFRNQAEDDGEEGFDNEDSFGQPGLGGIHRVDSMVDELLKEDLLASPSAHKKEMENATNSNRKPLPSLPPPTSTAETQVQKANGQSSKDGSLNKTVSGSELPSLPNWSPLIFDDTPLPEVEDLPPPSNHVRRENSSSSISDEERIERELELEVAAEVPVRRGGSKPSNRIVNSNANANGQTSASVVGGNESPRRNGSVRSRPHISRDKILERVAQEKRNASSKMDSSSASPESHGNRGSRPSEPSATSNNDSKATVQTSHTTSDFSARNQVGTSPNKTAARPRNSEPQSIQTNRTESIPKRPGMPSNSASFPKAATLPSPVKETDLERGLGLSGTAAAASSQQSDANAVGGGRRGSNLESPLERLSSEVEAQQMMGMNSAIQDEEAGLLSTKREVKLSNASNLSEVEARKREQGWFDENNTSLVRETSVEPESSLPLPPPKNDYLSAHEASSNSTTSPVLGNGRLSPSLLGAPPKPLTPSQAAEQIIARRRSKKELKGEGRPTRRRSNSTPGRPITSSGLLESSNDFDSTKAENGSSTHHGNGTDSNASSLNSRESIGKDLARSKEELDRNLNKAIEIGFGRGIEREISRIYREGDQKYKVNDRGTFTGVEDKIAHSSQAGDVDSGKAWRKLRRPSDINEYAKEMREYRESENPKKALGKVFVMVDSFTPENLPIPNKTTKFYAVLDNGLHMVKTGTSTLRSGQPSKIGQEFELIQHKNLQFSLTLVVVRDSHLIEPNPNLMTPSSPKKDKHSPSLTSGFSRFFTSPKKQAAKLREREMDNFQNQVSMRSEPILNYINREGAFGRSNVVFDQVASNCLARCLVLELPVSGVSDPSLSLNGPSSNSISSVNRNDFNRHLNKVRGTLRLKLFYLPPMPSVPKKLLPENLADCINGMNAAAATENEPRLEGVLTQLGGDCVSWRRRPVKAQGAHLICFNEITKKPTVKIDLSKAIAVEDNNDPLTPSPITSHVNTPSDTGTSASSSTYRSATIKKGFRLPQEEELDESYNVERSFRITFADGERISFFADTDEEKTRWLDCFKKVLQNEVSNVPVWAGLAYDLLKNRNLEKRQLQNSNSSAQVQPRNPQPQQQSQSLNSTATPLRNSVSKRIQPQLTPVSEIQSTPNQNQRRPVSIAFAPTPTPPSSLASQNPTSNKRSSVSTRPIYGQHQSSIPTPTRKPVPGSSSTVGSRPQSMFGATPTRISKP